MSETDYKLKIRNLRKTYGSLVALDDASIDLGAGEFLTLLGPSGSGKTTMLMAVAGLNDPDSGEVWIDGKLATYLPAFQRDIGMVFQNYALFPHMTIFENIAFPLRMRKLDRAAIRAGVQRVLDIVQLPDVADRLPSQLSGGQQQRIALARCFVYEPSIILMDEPLGALDKKLRDQLQLEIKHLHQQLGVTMLYVTHDQEEAMVMSDRICLMNDARIEQIGTPDDLYFRPVSLFAADFLGESNLVEAEVAARDGKGTLLTRGESKIRAIADGGLEPGQRVKFMVRPECVEILDAVGGDDGRHDNVVTATLKEVIMTGHVTKYFLALADGTAMLSTQLTRGSIREVALGRTVRLAWPQDRTVALKAEVTGP